MIDVIVAIDQEPVVLRVEDRTLDVIAREAADGILGVPEREQQELRSIADDAAQRQDAAIAGRARVLGEAGLRQVVEIGAGVPPLAWGRATRARS